LGEPLHSGWQITLVNSIATISGNDREIHGGYFDMVNKMYWRVQKAYTTNLRAGVRFSTGISTLTEFLQQILAKKEAFLVTAWRGKFRRIRHGRYVFYVLKALVKKQREIF
jgi:hypothetical protein